LTATSLAAVAGWGLANWVLDCGCLALSFVAVGVGVPWKGLLLAYGAAQLAANLPITPGGLGVVEGSLTITLEAFGGQGFSLVAVVLLYRILSFWVGLPVGWATWAVMAWADRRSGPGPEVVAVPERVEVTS
jgi:putative heme transporter